MVIETNLAIKKLAFGGNVERYVIKLQVQFDINLQGFHLRLGNSRVVTYTIM